MIKKFLSLIAVATMLAGCGSPQPAAPTAQPAAREATHGEVEEDGHEAGTITELFNDKLGPFDVRAVHVGDLSEGHFNFYVDGAVPKAVRSWVGDEAATGVMVTKANLEEDHYCAHIEVPKSITDDVALWFEIEPEEGDPLKVRTALAAKDQ